MVEFTKDQLKKATEQFINYGVEGFHSAKPIIGDKIAGQLLKIFIQNTKQDMITRLGEIYTSDEEKNIINEIIQESQAAADFDPLSHFLNLNRKNK